ncbi:MAG: hypothetical protein ACAI43_20325 [Phycisphaerae bacterium]
MRATSNPRPAGARRYHSHHDKPASGSAGIQSGTTCIDHPPGI